MIGYLHFMAFFQLALMVISIVSGPVLFGKPRGEYNYAWWIGQWLGVILFSPLAIAVIVMVK